MFYSPKLIVLIKKSRLPIHIYSLLIQPIRLIEKTVKRNQVVWFYRIEDINIDAPYISNDFYGDEFLFTSDEAYRKARNAAIPERYILWQDVDAMIERMLLERMKFETDVKQYIKWFLI